MPKVLLGGIAALRCVSGALLVENQADLDVHEASGAPWKPNDSPMRPSRRSVMVIDGMISKPRSVLDQQEGPTMADAVPSEVILDQIPSRALKFLGAVSTNPAIRAILAKRGYSQAVHEHGWELLLKASGYRRTATPMLPDSTEANEALAAVDKWDEPSFRVARATLAEFPAQLAFVFEALEAGTGMASVVAVSIFLDRLDALENDKNRKATRKADHAALAKLAERGFPPAERKRMRALCKAARGQSTDAPIDTTRDEGAIADTAGRRQAKLDLYTWYAEWREIAKADISRRDYLIQLGLAQRKAPTRKNKGGTSGGDVASGSGTGT